MNAPIIDIDSLNVEDRLDLIARLWESLCENPDAVPLTQAQREELDRRLDELDRGEVGGIPWEKVLERIQGRL